MSKRLSMAIVGLVALGALVAGCGSGSSAESPATTGSEPASQTTQKAGAEGAPAGAEAGGTGGAVTPTEAESLATGDIPDNQEFLDYTNSAAGYTIKYPAGWARTGSGNDVTFREKGNVIHVVVHPGKATLKPGEKRTLARRSAPDPVTGKTVKLMVDVYEYEHGGKVAVLELSTPEGVDNVDAYRLISESFEWR
ncbi:MAG: hypothetical protein JSU06_13000 [Actinobacteria bacterium]|nr:hypothetical protein [Actinomycetota bacterium]